MGSFKTEWDALFIEYMSNLAASNTSIDGHVVPILNNDVDLGKVKLTSDKKRLLVMFLFSVTIWQLSYYTLNVFVKCLKNTASAFDLTNVAFFKPEWSMLIMTLPRVAIAQQNPSLSLSPTGQYQF